MMVSQPDKQNAAYAAGPLPRDVVALLVDREFLEDERLRNPANWVELL